MTKALLLFLSLCISGAACAQKSDAPQWIVGTWKIVSEKGTTVERWKQINDTTFAGRSFFVRLGGDSVLQETVQLVMRKGEWSYISTVVGQNDGKSVAFRIIYLTKNEFISVNPEHDYPQRIAYRRAGNMLFASIEGMKRATYRKANFDYKAE